MSRKPFSSLAVLTLSVLALVSKGTCEPPELNEKLYEAASFLDAPKVAELLKQGANPNFKATDRPVISWAAQSGCLECVKSLVAAKADINLADGLGHTALMRAVDVGNKEVADYLISVKADPNVKTKNGDTALIMAVKNNKPELVKALLAIGADPNARTKDDEFPALIAAQDNMKEIIELLGAAKADLNASNAAYTPLTYAINQNLPDLVQVLLKAGADPNGKDQQGRTPLMLSLDTPELTKMLIEAKANPNLTDERGDTALIRAIGDGSAMQVETLIKSGADVNFKKKDGRTPLAVAKDTFANEIVELLQKNGAKE